MSIKTEAVEAELAMMMDPEAEAGKQMKFDPNRSLSVPRTYLFSLISISLLRSFQKRKNPKNNESLISFWDEQDAMDQAEAAEIEELEVAEDIMVNEAIVRIWKN